MLGIPDPENKIARALEPTNLAMAIQMTHAYILDDRAETVWLYIANLEHLMLKTSMLPDNIHLLKWESISEKHALWHKVQLQVNRPVLRTGRLVDLLVEGQPALIESPLGKSIFRFDGNDFSISMPCDSSVLFDRGWKVRGGETPLELKL